MILFVSISSIALAACKQSNNVDTSSQSTSQNQSSNAHETIKYDYQHTRAYWLKYKTNTYFVVSNQVNEQINTKEKLTEFLRHETTQDLGHDSYKKLSTDGFIFISANKVTQKQSFGYGNVTVGVSRDYTLYAITGNANLYEPMYNKFKVTDITSI